MIRRIAAHDAEAFTTLYQRYAPRLAGFLYPRLAQPDLVDDVLHETFVCFRRACVNLVFLSPTVILINERNPMTWRR